MKRVLFALCFVWSALTAHATPPDVLTVKDKLFGMSADYVFVLRTTSDNHGSYYTETNDVVLIATHIKTGKQTLWHLYRVTRTQLDYGEMTMRNTLPKNAVNPYAILAQYKGVTADIADVDTSPKVAELTSKQLSITSADKTQFALATDAWLKQQKTSLKKTAKILPIYERVHPLNHRELIAYLQDIPAKQCKLIGTKQLKIEDNKPVQLANFSCHQEYMDAIEAMHFFVVVPKLTVK